MKRFIAAVALLAVVAGCAPAGPIAITEEDRATIRASIDGYREAAVANDMAALAVFYAEDAVLMASDRPGVQGRAAIQETFESFPTITEMSFGVEEIEGLGDLAYVRGTYEMTLSMEGMPPIADHGKWLEIRRKQADGSWPITRDIFNSDVDRMAEMAKSMEGHAKP